MAEKPWLVNGVGFDTLPEAEEFADRLERLGMPVDVKMPPSEYEKELAVIDHAAKDALPPRNTSEFLGALQLTLKHMIDNPRDPINVYGVMASVGGLCVRAISLRDAVTDARDRTETRAIAS